MDSGVTRDGDFYAIEQHPAETAKPPLGEAPSIHPSAIVRRSRLGPWTAVGARTTMMETTFGAYSYVVDDGHIVGAEIGKFVSIAAGVRINPGNHPTWRATQHHFTYRAASYDMGEDDDAFFAWRRRHPVAIGHDVWIGHGAIVLPGRRVGDGAVVGAGAVVAADVAPYAIVAGVPARTIKTRASADVAAALQRLAWWDWPRDRLIAVLPDLRALDAAAFVAKYG
jgi:phosphonate metabolism protein (transferase hexapeptide repeat family)